MSKISTFLLMSLLALTFSCGDDDASVELNDDSLVGIWNLETLDYAGTSTTTTTYGTTTSDFVGEGSDITATVEFMPDLRYLSSGSYTITLVSDVGGYNFEQDVVFTDFLGTGDWDRDGDLVSARADGETEFQTLTITELTDSTLRFDFTITMETIMQGASAVITFEGNYTFSK